MNKIILGASGVVLATTMFLTGMIVSTAQTETYSKNSNTELKITTNTRVEQIVTLKGLVDEKKQLLMQKDSIQKTYDIQIGLINDKISLNEKRMNEAIDLGITE